MPNWYAKSLTPFGQKLLQLRPQLAQAAQRVYDEWEQDEEGMDIELGVGGICQNIAEAMASVLAENGIECQTVDGNGVGEQHVWVIAYNRQTNEVYDVNIPPNVYEQGSMYTWKKLPDIQFSPNHVSISINDATNIDELEDF